MDELDAVLAQGLPVFSVEKRSRLRFGRDLVVTLLSLAIIVLGWQLLAVIISQGRGIAFPTPWQTMQRFGILLAGQPLYNQTIIDHLFASLQRWGAGFGLAVFCGLGAGLLLGSRPLLYQLLLPAVHVIQLIPGLAWIPIALLIFGIGDGATIFMIFIMGVAPIVINTASGIRALPPIYINSARMLGAGPFTIFFQVMLPGATLAIVSGLRLGLASSWRVLIAAEMVVGAGLGLGYTIIQSRWSLDFEASFVAIALIAIFGLVAEKLFFELLEKSIMSRMGLGNR